MRNQALFISLAIAAAGSPPAFAEPTPQDAPHSGVAAAAANSPPAEGSIATAVTPLQPKVQAVLMQALSLIGVNYRFGGNSIERGFDCSGFVRYVFAEAAEMNLPRNSYAMSRLGVTIDKDQLEPGDLVFYNTLRRQFSHVAIYLGEGRFVHAPSRGKQVEIIDMADSYWKKRYNGARRLLTVE
ncbi:MAG: C40 family peptidase [Betaproteobacteria bacterium]|nr:C40 family peptidase [Betaproteobacteria bacterium]